MAIPEDHSWRLDTIAFKDYGVSVAKSSGVLDMPRIVDVSTDWLDQNGRDYWQDQSETKYQEREIVLSCFVKATGYIDFQDKVAGFYAALHSTGLRTLSTPYGVAFDNVICQQNVAMVRKTQYVKSLQIGMFTLRLTVLGDSQSKAITIYDATGAIRGVYWYGSDARLTQRLQGEDVITFDLELQALDTIGRDDFIWFEGSKYISFEYPEITKQASNKFIYKCTFQHQFFRLKDCQFRVLDRSEFPWWATLEEVVDQIVINGNRLFPGLFVKGQVEDTIHLNHQFSNESCFEVLARMAADYSLEYGFRQYYSAIEISVVLKTGSNNGLSFSYGKGNQLYSINRVSSQRESLVTHLYAYGSNKNIPYNYKGGGKDRLELATMPLVKTYFETKREFVKVFDDIKPERIGAVTGYVYTPSPDPVKSPQLATYQLTDLSFPFDLNAKDASGNTIYLIAGTTAKIHFNSGDCAGFEFEVLNYTHATKTFKLIPLSQGGQLFPNASIYPAPGNEYVMIDINLPQDPYINDAQARLLVRAQAFQNEYNPPKVTFRVNTVPEYESVEILPGDTVTITDTDFGTETLRITELTRNIYQGGYSLTIADLVELNNREKLNRKVDAIAKGFESLGLGDVNVQRRDELTSGEVQNKLIDPLDEMMKANEIIRDNSLDPRMLDYDTSAPQFSIIKGLVVTSVDNVPNKVEFQEGSFIIHNYYALNRDEIATLKSASLEYNPTREWTIPETVVTLPDDEGVSVYLKVAKLEGVTDATVVTSKEHIEVKAEEDYLHYKIGYINPVSGGIRNAAMLWGNVKPVAVSNAQSGRLSGLVTRSVLVTFPKPFASVPIGRKNIHAYRLATADVGKVVDQDVIFYGLTVTTTGFSLTIDPDEGLSGVVIEYEFNAQT